MSRLFAIRNGRRVITKASSHRFWKSINLCCDVVFSGAFLGNIWNASFALKNNSECGWVESAINIVGFRIKTVDVSESIHIRSSLAKSWTLKNIWKNPDKIIEKSKFIWWCPCLMQLPARIRNLNWKLHFKVKINYYSDSVYFRYIYLSFIKSESPDKSQTSFSLFILDLEVIRHLGISLDFLKKFSCHPTYSKLIFPCWVKS